MLRIVVMGVSGCGKSSVGAALSKALDIPYVDADDLHSPANVDKMAKGIPLQDEDRWPWLTQVGEVLRDRAPVIVGCSSLKHRYRQLMRDIVREGGTGGDIRFVHLAAPREVIETRMAARAGHFMPVSLLDSQYAALEAPDEMEALTVDISQSLPQITAFILQDLSASAR